MPEIINDLPTVIEGFSGKILSYALVLAAVATITMTFLELIKVLLNLRLQYHRRKIKDWLDDNKCLEELLILTVAGVDSAGALFDQPTDKMLGQIQAATTIAIDFPAVYPKFYSFLTEMPSSKAAAEETGGSGKSSTESQPTDSEVWRNFITQVNNTGQATVEDKVLQNATRARARIDHFVARKLDAFQTGTEYNWARFNQYLSVVLSAIVLTGLLLHMQFNLLPALVLAFFGGMMAPLAKDVVSALSGLKAK
jgi:hypothetical protein